ncbi:Something about silencing protein 10 [Mactra antiquata]
MPRSAKRGASNDAEVSEKSTRKGKKKGITKAVPEYVNDDEIYGNFDEPDPESREYMYDDVDEFHNAREKMLLDSGYQDQEGEEESEEEEVLALDSEDSDDDEIRALKAQLRQVKQFQRKKVIGSDIEDQSEEDEEAGLPDNKAWGSRRNRYYGDDQIVMRKILSDDEEAEALLEEKEALRLQKQMAEELDDQDFGLDMFQPTEKTTKESEKSELITKDLSALTEKEKLKLIKKKSPELLTLIDDFKDKMAEFQKLSLVKDWIEKEKHTGSAVDYVYTKMKLNLNYCTNIVFYLMLKSKQITVENHPVIKRILQYKKIATQLEAADKQLKPEIDEIVSQLQNGEIVKLENKSRTMSRKQKNVMMKTKSDKQLMEFSSDSDEEYEDFSPQNKKAIARFETADEKEALMYYDSMKAGRPGNSDMEDNESDMDDADEGMLEAADDGAATEEKRAITYQIEKNKGLTAPKKKALRNPRVKHRMKYKKAKVRRKGQFREPRTEMQKYGGEISGIRVGVTKGVKLK